MKKKQNPFENGLLFLVSVTYQIYLNKNINIMTYCEFVKDLEKDALHKKYHDEEYGFPIHDDNLLFERLVLEINQAGLSWTTILKKRR